MSELWPFISPWNVWDLRYGDWVGYRDTYDDRLEEARKRNQK